MTNNKPKPITLHDAGENRAFIGLSVSGIGGVWVENCEGGMPSGLVRLSTEDTRRLRDWLTDYLGDEDDTDNTKTADDGWEEVTDWDNNPPRPGDEVTVTHTVGGVTVTRQGTYEHLDSYWVAQTPTDEVIGNIERGTWRVRRSPAPDPADVLTPGTIIRDAKTDGILRTTVAQVDDTADYAIGVWSRGAYEVPIDEMGAFTVESTGDRWEKKDGRWTITKKEHRND